MKFLEFSFNHENHKFSFEWPEAWRANQIIEIIYNRIEEVMEEKETAPKIILEHIVKEVLMIQE